MTTPRQGRAVGDDNTQLYDENRGIIVLLAMHLLRMLWYLLNDWLAVAYCGDDWLAVAYCGNDWLAVAYCGISKTNMLVKYYFNLYIVFNFGRFNKYVMLFQNATMNL